jgi:hypothetical protein
MRSWIAGAAVVLLALLALNAYVSGARAQRETRELTAARDGMAVELKETRSRLLAMEAKLDWLSQAAANSAASANPAPAVTVESPARPHPPRASASKPVTRKPVEDPRFQQIETQLAEHQKQIASNRQDLATTRQDLDKTGTDLRGRLDSTKDELSGSIAKNHDELVQLQKMGESTFHEFTLAPSKQFQRVGPLGVSLQKTNTKRQYFDVSMMVDDIKLEKKHVNLYEPVWINLSDRPQPVELVVNKIAKNEVQGYIREPKYKKSELAATAAPAESKADALQTR